ncbi:hypothetical protein COCCADRAFT_97029 [Bipolaris zeicola 26-R-13]|uniref:Uncharacterized protein n=1 Tax=Cochliobolus carbonum (strain 26-R-13) TaxID=930089 RepID=W6YNL1_COCC2|nr:uncharacterized protein COCCADRAFT_97029 [Bipolaris zeicola 26-R-13]EUC33056.1 hypothetical protein COCCADRAFT_97029 [Bipolaris zeicola 26-R-13]
MRRGATSQVQRCASIPWHGIVRCIQSIWGRCKSKSVNADSPAAIAPFLYPITCLVKKCGFVYRQWSSSVNGVVVTFK